MDDETINRMLRLFKSNLLWTIPVTLAGAFAGCLCGLMLAFVTGNKYLAVEFGAHGSWSGDDVRLFWIILSVATGLCALLFFAGAQVSWFLVNRDRK